MDKRNLFFHNYLLSHLRRLLGEVPEETLDRAIQHYIFDELPDSELMAIYRSSNPPTIKMPKALENDHAFYQTLKVIGLLEASNSWEEFQKLAKQRKLNITPKDEQINDFDKLLKAFIKVAPPKKTN